MYLADQIYPGILYRVKAAIVDSVVLLVFMITTTYAFSLFEHVSDNARIVAFLFIFVFYDPLFTSMFGGTLGHKMNGISVKKDADNKRNLFFPLAFVRFLVKITLGWLSLLTMSGNDKRKAIHDFMAGSVVIYELKK